MASRLLQISKAVIDAIVFSNIWISLGALSLYASIKLFMQQGIALNEAAIVFSATFLAYNLLKLKGLNFEANQSTFNGWMRKHKFKIYAMMFGFGLIALYAFSTLNFFQLSVLGLAALVSAIYIGVERFNLRSFWFLKTQMVAFVWAIFIVGIAFGSYNFDPSLIKETYLFIALLFAAVFFLILGLTIPFDIRDWQVDSLNEKMKTLPMVFGLKGTKYLAVGHLLLSYILLYFINPSAVLLTPIYLAAVFTIIRLRQGSSEYNYTFILDGLIVLVYPMLLLSLQL